MPKYVIYHFLYTAHGVVEELAADTSAYNLGAGFFKQTLEEARNIQDENQSTAI